MWWGIKLLYYCQLYIMMVHVLPNIALAHERQKSHAIRNMSCVCTCILCMCRYMKYDMLEEQLQPKLHIFSTFFYTRLSNSTMDDKSLSLR